MKNIVLSIVLLMLLFGAGSCRMHNPTGTPYKIWHITGRTHKHWGAPRWSNSSSRYWSRHKYGPRTYKYRGHFRDYQYH